MLSFLGLGGPLTFLHVFRMTINKNGRLKTSDEICDLWQLVSPAVLKIRAEMAEIQQTLLSQFFSNS
jgi:hypothetical protein